MFATSEQFEIDQPPSASYLITSKSGRLHPVGWRRLDVMGGRHTIRPQVVSRLGNLRLWSHARVLTQGLQCSSSQQRSVTQGQPVGMLEPNQSKLAFARRPAPFLQSVSF